MKEAFSRLTTCMPNITLALIMAEKMYVCPNNTGCMENYPRIWIYVGFLKCRQITKRLRQLRSPIDYYHNLFTPITPLFLPEFLVALLQGARCNPTCLHVPSTGSPGADDGSSQKQAQQMRATSVTSPTGGSVLRYLHTHTHIRISRHNGQLMSLSSIPTCRCPVICVGCMQYGLTFPTWAARAYMERMIWIMLPVDPKSTWPMNLLCVDY